MAYNFPEVKKFDGLHLQANSFTVPDGAMEEALNLVIRSDDIASKTRGNYSYFSPSGNTLKKLIKYQNRLLSVSEDEIAYYTDTGTPPNVTGTATVLVGETVAVTGDRVPRSAQGNDNLYVTTDEGVLKLEAYNSQIFKAGIAQGLDLNVKALQFNGPIGGDTQIGYRVLFGRRDANSNLNLGAPSDTFIFVNAPAVGVSYTSSGAGPYTVTVTSTSHNLATGMSVVVVNATNANANGTFTITVVDANTFTYSTAANPASGTLDWSATRRVRLEFSVPDEINDANVGYFFQVYRTSQSVNATTVPTPDFKLVSEEMVTATQIANNVAFFDDDIDEILLGAELYTNPNSREGELQANYMPPLCKDLVLFKDHLLYFNCITKQFLNLDIVDTSAIVAGDFVEIKVDALTRRYVFRSGVANRTVNAESVAGVGTVTITYTAHGFSNGYTVFVSNVTGTVPEGSYTISGVTANTFDITSPGNTATALEFQGVTDGTNSIAGFDSSSVSIAVQLRTTAQLLVKAVNRDASSVVYGQYVSGIDDIPGKMRFTAIGFGGLIYMRANSATVGDEFNPTLPDSFLSGTQVYSTNDAQPHVFYSSKTGELEAVPVVNFYPVGSKNQSIRRAFALRDSVIILKEDGVFRMTGDDPTNFNVTALDTTIFIAADSSADLLNNQVICLTNQGVCLITESSVQIVSRKIDDVIQPILGSSALQAQTGGVAYESERLYILTTIAPNTSSASVTYLYNILNSTWTTWGTLIDEAVIGPQDTLFLINTAGNVQKERKTQSKIDYCDQNYSITVTSVAPGGLSAVINSPNTTPEFGDVILKNNVFNRILAVTGAGPSYTITLARITNMAAADSLQLYKKYLSRIKMAPFHGGQVGLMKQFSEFQIHTRQESVSRMRIEFTGYTFGGSEVTEWTQPALLGGIESLSGWGFNLWGFFPWGEEEGINILAGTKPAPVIRIYVPRFQQRNTFIQAVMEHNQAGEQMNLQAIAWSVRSYQQRVSK